MQANQPGAYMALEAVQADCAGEYAIEFSGSVVSDLAGGYGITATVVAEASGGYQVQALVSAGQGGEYAVISAVSADVAGAYALIERVAAVLAGEYAIQSEDLPVVRAPSGSGYQRPVGAVQRHPLLQAGNRPVAQPNTIRPDR